ncbi:MAG: histidine triad nucleotide-binding protein [Chloroflexi bacterium]|nr:histidine triad nucleotide-binding protein [Chloroflexota bacterium]
MAQASGCIFCRIVAGEIPSDMVYQDPEVIAIRDIRPQAPLHVLVLPRTHLVSLAEVDAAQAPLLGRMLLVVKQVAEEAGVTQGGYRVITNIGRDSGQEVPHLHWHVLGGRPLGPLVSRGL